MLDRKTVEFCVYALNEVLKKEGSVNVAGIAADGSPIFGNVDGTEDEKRRVILETIKKDKEKHG